MKKIYILIYLFFILHAVLGQSGMWTWIHGSNTSGSPANYGTKGVPSPSNEPRASYEPCEWTDLGGNFWMFGGSNSQGDLWKYNPVTNEWTWMDKRAASYGVQGIPSVSNYPPNKSVGAGTWVDLNGNFWLFGDYSGYNDLWKYEPATDIWTWMKGSQVPDIVGVYGTKGVADIANTPGGRWECVATWTDNAGDLWVFGGYNSIGVLNDLWRFSIATNQWTWMKGSKVIDQPGVYGIKGVEDSANTPCSRMSYSTWTDNCGDLWLFGGFDYTNKVEYNDLWRYNIKTNNWTWISGSNVGKSNGIYGSKCIASSSNAPRARYENRACWKDQHGNFWLFGGGSYAAGNKYNDLWMYCITSNQWMWQAGDSTANVAGNWGTLGVPAPTNKPGGRFGSVGWSDNKGSLYLFGANLSPSYNDLWKYSIDTLCTVCQAQPCSQVSPHAEFQLNDSDICEYDCVNFTDFSINATSWQWTFEGGSPPTSMDQNPQSVCYQMAGIYDIKLVVSGSGGSDSVKFSNIVHVEAVPITPQISLVGTTLYCTTDSSYSSYQWYDSTAIIPGATDTFLVVSHSGNYNVQVSNENDCKIAVGINVVLTSSQNLINDNRIVLSPNPATNQLTIRTSLLHVSDVVTISIVNVLGEIIHEEKLKWSWEETINIKRLPAGIYFLQMKGESGSVVKKFVKE